MPLHWVASGGHSDIARFLLDLRVPVDNKDDVSSFCIRPIVLITVTIKYFLFEQIKVVLLLL